MKIYNVRLDFFFTELSDSNFSSQYSCGIDNTGKVICWGPLIDRTIIDPTKEGYWAKQVSVSEEHASMVAVKINPDQSLDYNNTRVYSWRFLKNNYEERLNNDFPIKKIVSGIFSAELTAGNRHYTTQSPTKYDYYLGIRKDDNTLIIFGDVLDIPNNQSEYLLAPLPEGKFIDVAAGWNHAIGLRDNGKLLVWGSGIPDNSSVFNTYGELNSPTEGEFIQVAAGRFHCAALREDGTVVCWGAGSKENLTGTYPHYGQSIVPEGVLYGKEVIQIVCGAYFTAALLEDGTVEVWGSFNPNNLDTDPTPQDEITEKPLNVSDVKQISCGDYYVAALKNDGKYVYAWGYNKFNGMDSSELGPITAISQFNSLLQDSTRSIKLDKIAAAPRSCFGLNIIDLTQQVIYDFSQNLISNRDILTILKCSNRDFGDDIWREVCQQCNNDYICNIPRNQLFSKPNYVSIIREPILDIFAGVKRFANIQATNPSFLTYTTVKNINEGLKNNYHEISGYSDFADFIFTKKLSIGKAGELVKVAVDAKFQGYLSPEMFVCDPLVTSATEKLPEFTFDSACGNYNYGYHNIIAASSGPIKPIVEDVSIGYRHGLVLLKNKTLKSLVNGTGLTALNDRTGQNPLSNTSSNESYNDVSRFWAKYEENSYGEIKQISSGYYHNCILKNDGTIDCWGRGETSEQNSVYDYGQAVIPTGTFKTVSCGNFHNVAITTDDTVVCWGAGQAGGTRQFDYNQCVIPSITSPVKLAACGGYHTVCVLDDNSVVAWGLNTDGQCDIPDTTIPIKQVVCGSYHTIYLLQDGTTICKGSNIFGQSTPPNKKFINVTANGNASSGIDEYYKISFWGEIGDALTSVPERLINLPNNRKIEKVVSGPDHNICVVGFTDDVTKTGTIDSWGNDYLLVKGINPNFYEDVFLGPGANTTIIKNYNPNFKPITIYGDGASRPYAEEPLYGTDLISIVDGRAKSNRTIQDITTDTSLTQETKTEYFNFIRREKLKDRNNTGTGILKIAAGANRSAAIKQIADIKYTNTDEGYMTFAIDWGATPVANGSGSFQPPAMKTVFYPKITSTGQVIRPVAKSIKTSGFGTVILIGDSSGNNILVGYGDYRWGSLGGIEEYGDIIPTVIAPDVYLLTKPDTGNFYDFDCSRRATIAIREDTRELVIWTFDEDSINFGLTVLPNAPGRRFKQISCGDYHAVALDESGNVYCWGAGKIYGAGSPDYNYGQSIIPNTVSQNKVVEVSAGGAHTLAILENGTVVGWGAGQPRQTPRGKDLGQATIPVDEYNQPIKAKKISAGGSHSLAITLDNRLIAWGDDRLKQCSQSYSSSNTFIDIAAGEDHSLGLTDEGVVFGWGRGSQEKRTVNDLGESIPSNFEGFAPRETMFVSSKYGSDKPVSKNNILLTKFETPWKSIGDPPIYFLTDIIDLFGDNTFKQLDIPTHLVYLNTPQYGKYKTAVIAKLGYGNVMLLAPEIPSQGSYYGSDRNFSANCIGCFGLNCGYKDETGTGDPTNPNNYYPVSNINGIIGIEAPSFIHYNENVKTVTVNKTGSQRTVNNCSGDDAYFSNIEFKQTTNGQYEGTMASWGITYDQAGDLDFDTVWSYITGSGQSGQRDFFWEHHNYWKLNPDVYNDTWGNSLGGYTPLEILAKRADIAFYKIGNGDMHSFALCSIRLCGEYDESELDNILRNYLGREPANVGGGFRCGVTNRLNEKYYFCGEIFGLVAWGDNNDSKLEYPFIPSFLLNPRILSNLQCGKNHTVLSFNRSSLASMNSANGHIFGYNETKALEKYQGCFGTPVDESGNDRSFYDYSNMLYAEEPYPNNIGYSEVVAWGNNDYGQCDWPPAGITIYNFKINLSCTTDVGDINGTENESRLAYTAQKRSEKNVDIDVGGNFNIYRSPLNEFNYRIGISPIDPPVAWGDNTYGQTKISDWYINLLEKYESVNIFDIVLPSNIRAGQNHTFFGLELATSGNVSYEAIGSNAEKQSDFTVRYSNVSIGNGFSAYVTDTGYFIGIVNENTNKNQTIREALGIPITKIEYIANGIKTCTPDGRPQTGGIPSYRPAWRSLSKLATGRDRILAVTNEGFVVQIGCYVDYIGQNNSRWSTLPAHMDQLSAGQSVINTPPLDFIDSSFSSISIGDFHVIGITKDRQIKIWGISPNLAFNAQYSQTAIPGKIASKITIQSAVAGKYHNYILEQGTSPEGITVYNFYNFGSSRSLI